MARLTIEQTAAPDFSDSALMMRGANESFNKGIDSAQGILAQYNKGQQAKDDMKAIELIAQQRNEGELDALLASGQLGKLNLSDTLRGNVANLRGDVIGNVSARDTNTRGNNADGRAAAGEARTASEHIDMVAARAERRSMTPDAVAAFNEANQYGTAGTPAEGATSNDREVLAKTLQAEAAGEGYDGMVAAGAVIRNRAANGKYGGSNISDVIMKPGQFSAWNAVTGYAGGEGAIDMENLKVSDNAYAAADAILSGNYEDKTGGATHYYNPNAASPAWGNQGNWTTIGNHKFGNPDGGGNQSASGPAPGYNPDAVTSVGIGGKGYQDFSTKVAGSLYMDPTEATGLLTGALTEQRATDARIAAAEQLRQADLIAGTNIDNLQKPGIRTSADMVEGAYAIPGISNTNRIAAGEQAGALAAANGETLSPTVKANPQATAAAELAAADAARSNELDPSIQAFEQASAYDTAEGGPGAALVAKTGAEATGVLAPDNVDRVLSDFAKANDISAGEAAVVFNSVAQGNAEQMAAQMQTTSDTDMYANLSSIADKMFGADARTAFQDDKLGDVGNTAQRDAIQANILVAKTDAAKMPVGSSERAAAEENIRLLEAGSIAANQPQKTKAQTAKYLGIEPAQMAELSPNDKKAAEDAIRSNPDLSVEEKTLLIMGLRL